MKPLISILIPFKNTASYLEACIDSIRSQTYANWELLIVDDHSEDLGCEIVKKHSKNDSRIILLKNSGHGIIDALQMAFSKCKGTYVTRMDSDDTMTPNKLEVLQKALSVNGRAHVAIGQVNYFRKNGIGEGYANYETWINELTATGDNYSEIYKECVIPSPCWMIHREDLIACGAFNPNNYPEDYDLAFRFYKFKMKCIPCNTVIHNWRDYAERTSRTDGHYAENNFLELKLNYFLELDYDRTRPLTLWGAGFKGKSIAKLLKLRNIPFIWICNNSKKIGKHIYKVELYHFHKLKELNNPQTIVTVANQQSQKTIKDFLKAQNKQPTEDYFFFC